MATHLRGTRSALPLVLLPLLLAGCRDAWPSPPAVTAEEFQATHDKWRMNRRNALVASGGPVLWIGLTDLTEGVSTMGSDSTHQIVLPAGAPPLAGTFHRMGQEVHFEPAPGVALTMVRDSTPVTGMFTMISDAAGNKPSDMALGALRIRLHEEPGTDRRWIRVWDEEHPLRQTFQLPEQYTPDPAWRVAARLDSFPEPRPVPVADISGGQKIYQSPGELVFERDGAEHRLIAITDSSTTNFFMILWDQTGLTTTYQAARYMRVPFPDETGWTVIDFNRMYNPPCVFSKFSMCALPPPENRMDIAIEAGEKRAH